MLTLVSEATVASFVSGSGDVAGVEALGDVLATGELARDAAGLVGGGICVPGISASRSVGGIGRAYVVIFPAAQIFADLLLFNGVYGLDVSGPYVG